MLVLPIWYRGGWKLLETIFVVPSNCFVSGSSDVFARIGRQSADDTSVSAAQTPNSAHGGGVDELVGNLFLYDNGGGGVAPNPNSREPALVDSLERILDLIQSTLGAEDCNVSVKTRR